MCGFCFAFAATGLYEAMILIASKCFYNISLSATYAMFLAIAEEVLLLYFKLPFILKARRLYHWNLNIRTT